MMGEDIRCRRAVPGAVVWAVLIGATAGCGDNVTPQQERDPYRGGDEDTPVLECLPNLDGRIDANEVGAALGVPISYLVSPAGASRSVDLVGSVNESGQRVWDFGSDYADDQVLAVSAELLTGKWYAAEFAGGQIVIPSDADGAIEGVYRQDESGLWLLGMASAVEDPPEGQTLLRYTAPVAVLRFPLEDGASWVAVGDVEDAVFYGLPYAAQDTYEVSVDGSGQLLLPDLTFTQALRVRTRLTVAPVIGAAVSVRQASFFFECFGEVVRAISHKGEPAADFTDAAQLRRVGLSL